MKYGFYNLSVGEYSDKVNAIAFCSGDAKLETCRSCIKLSTSEFIQLCPNYMEAIALYDYCMLRYLNKPIISTMSIYPNYNIVNANDVPHTELFNLELKILLDNLRKQPAIGGPLRKLGFGNTTGLDFQIEFIYALEYETFNFCNEIPTIAPPPASPEPGTSYTFRLKFYSKLEFV
ncbi:Cysteine-rich receptor-like protein kinase 26 [Camellia lanceoleosa]|uniref:Cysteine-rich receptor-like protein kinase 26 n=1 Tax=Camellia lanceoleosa TaxID=1840588 RepID=A0ACC0GGA6_9ERIC|nr:Cysteine-rich receptor-like protein kinase 26 [Camellia lanceoleosa]